MIRLPRSLEVSGRLAAYAWRVARLGTGEHFSLPRPLLVLMRTLHLRGLAKLETAIIQTGNRLTLALMTLGLYVAAAVRMLHAAGPHVFGQIPLFALLVFAGALYLSLRLVRSIARTGNP